MRTNSKSESSESRDPLSEDARAASAMGLSYGKYKALTYTPTPHPPEDKKSPESAPKRTKKYTDQQLFDLWQEGKSDAEIAACVGVSRAMIQRWRDIMEIPSSPEGRDKYRLIDTEYGLYAVTDEDLL